MDVPRILFVCTGNICRSPIAEGLLRHRAAARRVDLEVASCGLSMHDVPPTDEAQRAAAANGADIASLRSSILDEAAIEAADLVIGMERRHVREAVVLAAGSFPRCFTFKDFVRRAAAVGRRGADEPFGTWVGRVGAGRTTSDVLGLAGDDEVADPYGRHLGDYERCAQELSGLVDQLLSLGFDTTAKEGAA